MAELANSFKTIDHIYILPSILILSASYVLRAFRWQILLAPMQTMKVSELYSPLIVGFMSNILPGRAGEFIRAYLLKQRSSISFSGAFATIIVERLFDLLMMLLMFIWLFVFRSEVFATDARAMGLPVETVAVKFGQIAATLIAVLLVFIYLLVWHKEKFLTLVVWFEKRLPEKWANKVQYLVDEFSLGLSVIKDIRALIKILLFSILIWTAITVTFYPLYWAYDLQNKSLDSLVLMTVMVGIFITVLPTPAFLGSTNAAILISLHHIMGENELDAVSFGMVSWALGFVILLVGGVYFLMHDHLSLSRLVQAEEELAESDEAKSSKPESRR